MANFIEISSIDCPELDVYVRLTGPELRAGLENKQGIFIAESPTVIDVALKAGCRPISLLTDKRLVGGFVSEIIERCDNVNKNLPIYVGEKEILKKITGFELTRGALAAMYRPTLPSVSEIIQNARRIAVLEEVADSTNIGAIFRSAAALNVDAVLITPTSCDPLSRRALRVSMGTVLQVPWTKIGKTKEDWPKDIDVLGAFGFKTVAMALTDDSVSLDDKRLADEKRLAIILGTEGTGLKKETISKCDYTVKIPMSHGVDSLNVAAASAVAFWQLCR